MRGADHLHARLAERTRIARETRAGALLREDLEGVQRLPESPRIRALVVPQGPPGQDEPAVQAAGGSPECERETPERKAVQARSHRISWARLLARAFDIDMQQCPNCGAGQPKIIAAILGRPVIGKILTHLGLDPQPPPRGRARAAFG